MTKLKDSKNFVSVKKDGKIFYGGHQNWLKEKGLSKFFRDRACVVTAFTNVYFYMTGQRLVDFDAYNNIQYYFYRKIRPKANGVPTAKSLLNRLDIINHQFDLSLSYRILEDRLTDRSSLEEKMAFIEQGLNKDRPVIFINWLSKDIEVMRHHGLVITEMNKKDGKHELVVSSWGRSYRFFLEDFHNQARTYTGFIYFL